LEAAPGTSKLTSAIIRRRKRTSYCGADVLDIIKAFPSSNSKHTSFHHHLTAASVILSCHSASAAATCYPVDSLSKELDNPWIAYEHDYYSFYAVALNQRQQFQCLSCHSASAAADACASGVMCDLKL
jgi:hypothetical protein